MLNNTTATDSDGVSPVIGVILMVAITVILAAIIGTFVLDLAGNLEQNAQMSLTFDEDETTDTVTVQIISVQTGEYIELRSPNGPNTMWAEEPKLSNNADATEKNFVGEPENDGSLAGNTVIDFPATAGTSATLTYGAAGQITAVGYLDGEGNVLQRYNYG